MVRFLHTADWQLGLKLRFVPGDQRERARLQRYATVERIAELAREREVDAVVVCGDVFDDNAIGPARLQLARDALRCFDPIPVLLLPGNHDAAVPGGVLERLDPEGKLAHVRTLLGPEPVAIGDATFYPCPLQSRHVSDDPAAHLPVRSDGEGVRVALAHGGILEFSESEAHHNLIDWKGALAKGFDYLALGDWHGKLSFGAHTWYAGAPEATRFKEKAPGYVLLVEIDGPGAEPRVEPIAVGRTRWLQEDRQLEGQGDVDELDAWLSGLQERSWTLVDLTLCGELSLSERAALQALLERHEVELMCLRSDVDGVRMTVSEEEIAALAAPGFLGRAAQELGESEHPSAKDALRELYHLLREVPA